MLKTWLDYWSHVHVTGIDLGLERVIPVAEKLQIVHPNAKIITVAGTNGKGSTTTTIASILKCANYKVGLYQSPHIYRFNERVKISGIEVSDQVLIDAFVLVDEARRQCQLSLSFFEATTLATFLIFKQQNCDVWVLEVGLGGRLDVVNIVSPDVAVITNIGLDHIDWLGDTVEKIAYEKAGIIRPNIPVIFAGEQVLPQSIQNKVISENANLYCVNQDYMYQENQNNWIFASSGMTLTLPKGRLSVQNMATAVAATLKVDLAVSSNAICEGVQQAFIAGRFEICTIKDKTVIFDAGHNAHGVKFLLKELQCFLQKNEQYKTVKAVFSMLADKDILAVTQVLKPYIADWNIAELDVARAEKLENLQAVLSDEHVQSFNTVAQAFENACATVKQDQLILVCGSFHTLEAVWEYLEACQ